eukprot:jgi/Psemu1/56337/gm1.56337_g
MPTQNWLSQANPSMSTPTPLSSWAFWSATSLVAQGQANILVSHILDCFPPNVTNCSGSWAQLSCLIAKMAAPTIQAKLGHFVPAVSIFTGGHATKKASTIPCFLAFISRSPPKPCCTCCPWSSTAATSSCADTYLHAGTANISFTHFDPAGDN